MAIGLGIASLVLAVGGTVAQTRNKNRDIADQKAINELNASNLEAESQEAQKRIAKSNKRTAGLLKAHAASIGFSAGGSTTSYVDDIIKQGQNDLDWMKNSNVSRLGILRAESSARLRLNRGQRSAGVSAGIGNAIGSGVSSYTAAGGKF